MAKDKDEPARMPDDEVAPLREWPRNGMLIELQIDGRWVEGQRTFGDNVRLADEWTGRLGEPVVMDQDTPTRMKREGVS